MTAHPGFGLAALRQAREEEARRLARPPRSLLEQVPPDAPYENPDEVLHVWNGKRWVPWKKWLATAPLLID